MAEQLISSLSADFDPAKFTDSYRARVLDLIERKAAGEEIAVQPEAEDSDPAPDLMAALEASLAEIRSGDSDSPPGADDESAPAAKRPARKRSSSNGSGSGAAKGSDAPKGSGAAKSRSKAESKG